MSTQKQIDALLDDSWCASSSLKPAERLNNKPQGAPQDSYTHQQFEDYEESRKTQDLRLSHSQIQSAHYKKNAKLVRIQQEPQPILVPNTKKDKLSLQKPPHRAQNNLKSTKQSLGVDKLYLTHNYTKLQQRQKQQLFTTLAEENRQLKSELMQRNNELKKIQAKYKLLLDQKTQNTSTAKEQALQKKVSFLQGKLQKIVTLQKLEEQRNKYKTKISNAPQHFIPEEEANRREQQLLQMIDKLKTRLVDSDHNMQILQKKLQEGVEHNDQMLRKMRRVEQLQYRIDKMVDQAETDRNFIEILKEKIKELEHKLDVQKDRTLKMQVQMKGLQMSQLTHTDIIKQLEVTRRQKQALEISLKDLSSAMMSNVRKNFRDKADKIEDSQDLLKA